MHTIRSTSPPSPPPECRSIIIRNAQSRSDLSMVNVWIVVLDTSSGSLPSSSLREDRSLGRHRQGRWRCVRRTGIVTSVVSVPLRHWKQTPHHGPLDGTPPSSGKMSICRETYDRHPQRVSVKLGDAGTPPFELQTTVLDKCWIAWTACHGPLGSRLLVSTLRRYGRYSDSTIERC